MMIKKLVAITGLATLALAFSVSPVVLHGAAMIRPVHAAAQPPASDVVAAPNAEEELPARAERRVLHGIVARKAADSFVVKLRDGRMETVNVGRATRFVAAPRRRATFAQLQPGMRVNIIAAHRAGTTLAFIVQMAPPARAAEQHLGKVTAISATSITIHGAVSDRDHTASIVADTKMLPKGTQLAVGDRVVALYVNDPNSTDPAARIAMRITKIGPKPDRTPTPRPAQ